MKLIAILFLFFTGTSVTLVTDTNSIIIDTENYTECIESNIQINAIMLMDDNSHNCQQSESPIWTVTYESSGDWSCSSDGRVQCFPCNTEPEEHP